MWSFFLLVLVQALVQMEDLAASVSAIQYYTTIQPSVRYILSKDFPFLGCTQGFFWGVMRFMATAPLHNIITAMCMAWRHHIHNLICI
jgi:hypothetical protein